jgi:signal transduction histidine kinase
MITKQVLAFHRETKVPVELEVRDMVSSVLSLYEIQLQGKGIKVDFEKGKPFRIHGFPGELRQVLANLIGNAMDASPQGGKICIRVRPSTSRGVCGAVFTIHDSGPGIPVEIRHRILEPFFTTKELKGTGLGLWLARSIILKHHGTLRFRSNYTASRDGTCFRVFLPEGHSVNEQKSKRVQPARELTR